MFVLQIKIEELKRLLEMVIGRVTLKNQLPWRKQCCRGLQVLSQDEFVPYPQIKDEQSLVDYLQKCIQGMLAYCDGKNEQDCLDEGMAWEKARNALSGLSAVHPRVLIAKLLALAKNSSFPPEIRNFIVSLINDAFSHLKQQFIDHDSAKGLLALMKSMPDELRGDLYPALKDAIKIEENTRDTIWHGYNVDRIQRKSLTLA